jgi:hypothetical protein
MFCGPACIVSPWEARGEAPAQERQVILAVKPDQVLGFFKKVVICKLLTVDFCMGLQVTCVNVLGFLLEG